MTRGRLAVGVGQKLGSTGRLMLEGQLLSLVRVARGLAVPKNGFLLKKVSRFVVLLYQKFLG